MLVRMSLSSIALFNNIQRQIKVKNCYTCDKNNYNTLVSETASLLNVAMVTSNCLQLKSLVYLETLIKARLIMHANYTFELLE